MPKNPSNVPSRIPRIFAFKDHDLSLKLSFQDGYDITGLTAKLYYKDKFHTGAAEITIAGQLATVVLSKNDFLSINLPVFELFIYNNLGIAILGATIEVSTKPGNPVLETFNISLIEGEVISVEIVDAQASIDASQRAEQAAINATQANEEAQAIVPTLQTDINGRIPLTQKGTANGVGTLGSDLFQPLNQVKPSFIPTPNTNAIISQFLKSGNTYYGLKSQYTGSDILINSSNIKPLGGNISDSDIDNVVYFKFSDGNYGVRQFNNSSTIEEFGAIGNGMTDDSFFIQKSLNFNGKCVLSKNKNYLIKSKLNGVSDLQIIGNGSTISSNSDLLPSSAIIQAESLDKVYIENLKINNINFLGKVDWQSSLNPSIYVNNCQNIYIDNVEILNNPYQPIRVTNSNLVLIKKCLINQFYRDGIEVEYCQKVIIENNTVIGTGNSIGINPGPEVDGPGMIQGGTGIGIQIIRSGIVIVIGNTVDNTLDTGIKVETSDKITISTNTVTNSGKDGIKVHGRENYPQLKNVIISNNEVHNLYPRRPDGSGLIVAHDCDNLTINGNTLSDSTKITGTVNGIRVSSLYGYNKNVIVSNNNIGNLSNNSESLYLIGDGINSKDILINDNILKSSVIVQQFLGKTKIVGNLIDSYISTAIGLNVNKCLNVSIINNDITGSIVPIRIGLLDANGSLFKISNNYIESSSNAINIIPDTTSSNIISAFISHNIIENISGSNSNFAINLSPVTNYYIQSNIINNYDIGIYIIDMLNASKIFIKNNHISNINRWAIRIQGLSLYRYNDILHISNNTIKNVNTNGSSSSAISIQSGGFITYNIIKLTGNTFLFSGQSVISNGIRFEGSTSIKILLLILDSNYQDVNVLYTSSNISSYCIRVIGLSLNITPNWGTWIIGDVIFNSNPINGAALNWICTVSGSPGTWSIGSTISSTVVDFRISQKLLVAKNSTYNVLSTDHTLTMESTGGNRTFNLPPASSVYSLNVGQIFIFKKIDSTASILTIKADGSELIDGSNTYSLTSQYQSVTIQSKGDGYLIIGKV